MAEFKVTAPDEGFSGEVAGVVFSKGAATVDSDDNRAALAYFRRRGYKVEGGEQPKRTASRAKKTDE
ncbi:hypothetical protein ACOQFV_09035 [Nocardiopsis changdeensis]|uniref:Uncharacterized protein n=1 Tax=Nocardiopsis changdeensis TaxID=2831969 RepID=A0ABX8BDJ0_9ACTN|nr:MULTISPECIES: hypothetical protein [Nocardiopsis]QUX20314.1 hypothetical protein KGD84_17445 [Nocardiopsis changdeensis]QYX36244.1 hypothetical protein K1J57_26900 [Nocardiopsis sp. MT53]